MTLKLKPDFFSNNTIWVAKNLLGKNLCRRLPSGAVIKAMITETEAYKGFDDKASHAYKGRTSRTEPMFADPGAIYVYMVYGMHYCLNLITEKKDYPSAVLIRGVEGTDGPGRVCHRFKIDKKMSGQKIGKELWMEDSGVKITKAKVKISKRVGIDYAEESKDWPWRFALEIK